MTKDEGPLTNGPRRSPGGWLAAVAIAAACIAPSSVAAAAWNFHAGAGADVDQTEGILDETPPAPVFPAYSSLPGAPATLFLDFDGHFEPGPVDGVFNINTPVFDMDGNPSGWSSAELRVINEIWATVAEDFSPFNINVTTVDPGDFSERSGNLRVAIGGADFRDGENAGGTATVDAFADEDRANIVHLFPFDKFDGSMNTATFMANAASHEAAHGFGVWHQSKWDGSKMIAERHPGDGGRIPLMGDHDDAQAVWWRGTNSEGDFQDDMEVIARAENGFGYRPDDHANGLAAASPMNIGTATFSYVVPDGMGSSKRIVETRGVLIASGVIEKITDLDKFRFETGGGNVAVRFTNPKIPGNGARAGDLHATLTLYDSSGAVIAFDPDRFGSDSKAFDLYLPAGTYYLSVNSFGLAGDVGQYTVTVAEDAGPQLIQYEFMELDRSLLTLMVSFNEPANPLSFTVHDVRINGGLASEGVLEVAPTSDPRRFEITLIPSGYTQTKVAIGPDIADQFGNRMNQNQNELNGEVVDYALAAYAAVYAERLGYDAEEATAFESPIRARLADSDVDLAFEE